MADGSQQTQKSGSYYEELRRQVQSLVDDGVVSAAGTVTTMLTFLSTERDKQ